MSPTSPAPKKTKKNPTSRSVRNISRSHQERLLRRLVAAKHLFETDHWLDASNKPIWRLINQMRAAVRALDTLARAVEEPGGGALAYRIIKDCGVIP